MMLGSSLPLMQRIAPNDDSVSSLHDSAHRWCSLFENSTLGVAMADSAFRFLTANLAFLTMLGYSSEELQHLSFLEICDDEECDERRVPLRELAMVRIFNMRSKHVTVAKMEPTFRPTHTFLPLAGARLISRRFSR